MHQERTIRSGLSPVADIGAKEFCLRLLWVAAQMALAYCMADEFRPFFYQAF